MSYQLPSKSCELTGLIDAVEAHCNQVGLPDEAAYAAKLAAEEIVNNTIQYGCADGRNATIDFHLAHDGDSMEIIIEDDAIPFDPLTEAPDPHNNPGLPPTHAGGLGVFLVLELMDDAKYEAKNGGNRLLLRKSLARKKS